MAAARVALVAGATGLVGRAVLARLLDADTGSNWSAVHAVGRKAPGVSHPKLIAHLASSFEGFACPAVDDVFIALGTTIKTAGSRQAFRAVDFDAVLAVARSARAAGATRLAIVSAMGADGDSSIFYNRTKGEVEAAVSLLGFESVVIVRPALLLGDRASLGQADRPGEKWATRLTGWLAPVLPLVPANYRPVQAANVAAAMVRAIASAKPGVRVMLSGELQPG
ncbi:MAG: hypothetical protein EOO28_12695 [Comamonadaceae bacterium]|nr:MAG: hypothetical protein EOO28_12695 [Comamonadaceae bacterium]